jgi:hypothetical protein
MNGTSARVIFQQVGRAALWRAGTAMIVAMLAGCSTLQGTPMRYQPSADIVKGINLTIDDISDLQAATSTSDRNRLQSKAIAVIDQQFHQFARDLTADRANSSAVAAGTTLGASTAGAFVESVKAKTNYALFAAGIVGAFGIIDKSYFYEKTVPAMVAAMGAARAKVLLRTKINQANSISTYDGTAALADLEDYYSAGTVLSAISEITSKAEDDKKNSLDKVRALDVPTDAQIAARQAVRDAIWKIDNASFDKAKAAAAALQLPVPKTAADARTSLMTEFRSGTEARRAAVESALRASQLLK